MDTPKYVDLKGQKGKLSKENKAKQTEKQKQMQAPPVCVQGLTELL